MKYKGEFIGLNLKEERAIIESLVTAFSQYEKLTDNQRILIDTSIKVMMFNYEFKKSTFENLMRLFALLGIDPPEFHRDDKGGHFWGGWYKIPVGNKPEADKRLANRHRKRKIAWQHAWWLTFGETWDWEERVDSETLREHANELFKKRDVKVSEEKDPRDVVVIPFRRSDS